jgi:hypothetical protein
MAASPEATTPVAPAAPASTAPASVAPPVAPTPVQPVREQPSAAAIAQAVAASAAAGHAAAAAEGAQPPATGRQGDTVAVDGPAAPPDDGGGIGGLFAHAEPAEPVGTVVPPRTSVLPAAAPPAAAPPGERFSYWTDQSAPVEDGPDDDDERDRASGRRTAVWIAAALLVVAALGVGGWLLLHARADSGSEGGGAATATQAPVVAGPQVGDVQDVGGVQYTVEAVQVDDTCVGHAYGQTADFFADSDCTGLSRALYSADLDGRPVVVSVSRVRLADATTARNLRGITDSNGTGNVSDLLREGVRYTGSPAELSGAEYASAVSGPVVTIVESAWAQEDTEGDAAEIDTVADEGLSLQVPPFHEG